VGSKRKALVAKADKYFSLYIRKRDEICVTCGARDNLQCGHLFSRIAYSTRWDEYNAYCQCRSCNLYHEACPAPLTNYFLSKYGQGAYMALYQKYRTTHKYYDAELDELANYYKEKLNG